MSTSVEDCGAYSRVLIDETPDFLALHQLNPDRYPFLLESVSQGTPQSQYDILFAFPEQNLQLRSIQSFDFLSQLDQQWSAESEQKGQHHDLPFRGGWFVYLSYELLAQIEPRLSGIPIDSHLPIASATRIASAIIRDHASGQCWLLSESSSLAHLALMQSDIQQIAELSSIQASIQHIAEDEPSDFIRGVEKILNYCYEGDIFQVNLSRAWSGQLQAEADYLSVYNQLRLNNPAPFAGLARFGKSVICSSSPERLVCTKNENVMMRPIAGTRPRGTMPEQDSAHSSELLGHPKERAEHLMLLDLIRNDLGRVCDYGSVHVDEQMVLESYATVHHIVSNVCGQLRSDVTPGDIIRAIFPGGTITGCPKVRCMEIIHELETVSRGAYTGSMGYLNHNGDMDLNILIRTLVVQGSTFNFRTGAGIVADSNPHAELKETRHKAAGMLKALGCE